MAPCAMAETPRQIAPVILQNNHPQPLKLPRLFLQIWQTWRINHDVILAKLLKHAEFYPNPKSN
jgi:hypothetical protein